jgi:hypothetical protein
LNNQEEKLLNQFFHFPVEKDFTSLTPIKMNTLFGLNNFKIGIGLTITKEQHHPA